MKEISRPRLIIAMVALFLSSMCTLGDLVINPIVGQLYEVFADAPEALINFGITGPALVGLPFGVIAGRLCDKYNKKIVMVVGFAIFTVSAVLGATYVNIYYFVFMRCLATGVGWGLTNTAAYAILAQLFTDEGTHGKVLGWYNAAMSIIGALLAAAAGLFAVDAWQNAFRAYWISIPVLVLLIIFLPNLEPAASAEANAEDNKEVVAKDWWKPLVPLSIQVFFVAVCGMVFLYMISLYVESSGIGDSSFTGILSSVQTIATAVGSMLFGILYKKFTNKVYLPFIFIIAIAYILMGNIVSVPITVVAAIIVGFSWAFYFCYFYARCVDIVPASRAGTATGIVALADGIAATGCSYLLTGLMSGLNVDAVKAWSYIGYILLVVSVVSLIWVITHNKQEKERQAK